VAILTLGPKAGLADAVRQNAVAFEAAFARIRRRAGTCQAALNAL